jgi:hypothetical protein
MLIRRRKHPSTFLSNKQPLLLYISPTKPTTNQQVEISIYKGDKLLNENTPFVVNLIAPESKEQTAQKVNADLICVIDISGSMSGAKIHLVRESLKVLIDMMDPIIVAETIAYTPVEEFCSISNIISNTREGINGIGGIQTRGTYRTGMPGI